MDRLGLILAVAAVTYATRLAGLTLADRPLPAAFDRCLRYVPVAVFASLVAPGVAANDTDLLPRLVGAALAVLAVLRVGHLWVGLAVGMGGYWLARWLLPLLGAV